MNYNDILLGKSLQLIHPKPRISKSLPKIFTRIIFIKEKRKILFVIWSPVRHIVRQFLHISIIYDENLVSSNCNKTENLKILQMQTKYFMGKRRAL